jgi:hypothetical protein
VPSVAELLADVEAREREQGTAPRVPGQVPGAPDDALARAAAHASRLPASVEGHGGDAALWHAAQEMAALGLSEVDALTVLETYFSPRCTPPWDHHAIEWKVCRAVEEQQKLWEMYPPARARALAVAEAIPRTSADASYTTIELVGADDGITWGSIDENPPPRDYRILDFEWGAGRPLGLLASFNASKTLTSKQILVDYALGDDVLGKYKIGTRTTGRVMDLCYEQFTKAAHLYTRLARAAGASFEDLNQFIRFGRPAWYLSDGMGRPRNDELMAAREDHLKHLCEGFDICNVDPYSAASLGIDEGGSEFQGPARMLERVSEATGCAFMVCVHRGRDQEAEHARGHSSIDDSFDTTILISKHDEAAPNDRLFKCLKRPMYGFDPEVITINDLNEDGTPWVKPAEGRAESWGISVRAKGMASASMLSGEERRLDRVLHVLQRQRGQWLSATQVRDLAAMSGQATKETLALAEARGLVHMRPATKGAGFAYCWAAPDAPPPAAQGPLSEALTAAQSRFSGIKNGR